MTRDQGSSASHRRRHRELPRRAFRPSGSPGGRGPAGMAPPVTARRARLAGLRNRSDPSLGSSSGLFDLAAREWSGRLLEICGLQAAVCPEVLESGTVIGGVTKQAADETGLAEGTPVVVGGADTQLGLVGIGTIVPGQ